MHHRTAMFVYRRPALTTFLLCLFVFYHLLFLHFFLLFFIFVFSPWTWMLMCQPGRDDDDGWVMKHIAGRDRKKERKKKKSTKKNVNKELEGWMSGARELLKQADEGKEEMKWGKVEEGERGGCRDEESYPKFPLPHVVLFTPLKSFPPVHSTPLSNITTTTTLSVPNQAYITRLGFWARVFLI